MDIESIKVIKEKIKPNISNKSITYNSTGYSISVWALRNNYFDALDIFKAIQKKFKYTRELEDFDDIEIPSFGGKDDVREKPHYNVMFSGGYDSTALVLRHLEKGEFVQPFCLDFGCNEDVFRRIIIELLRSVYPTLGPLKKLFGTWIVNGNEEVNFGQQSVAAFIASRISKHYMENCKAVEIGYCMNDDALSWLKELKTLYKAGLETCLHEYRPPLEFPSIKKSHLDNSIKVDSFCYESDIVLPITCLDASDVKRKAFSVYDEDPKVIEEVANAIIDKKFNIPTSQVLTKETWLLMTAKEDEPTKKNKECESFIPSYIIRIDYNLDGKQKKIATAREKREEEIQYETESVRIEN